MEKTNEFQKKFKAFLKEIKWSPIWSPLDLALIGLLTAATIVASNFLTISTPISKINFSNAFIMLAGIWLGPVAGAFVGGCARLCIGRKCTFAADGYCTGDGRCPEWTDGAHI